MPSTLTIRELTVADFDIFREIRLESLKKYPENFTSSYQQEKEMPPSFFKKMLKHNIYYGCLREKKLLGICGFMPMGERIHTAHKGLITGFYIRKEYRGRGFAKKLMDKLLDHVRADYSQISIRVNSSNAGIHRLYKKLGFKDIGLEKKSLKIKGKYVNEFIMQQILD